MSAREAGSLDCRAATCAVLLGCSVEYFGVRCLGCTRRVLCPVTDSGEWVMCRGLGLFVNGVSPRAQGSPWGVPGRGATHYAGTNANRTQTIVLSITLSLLRVIARPTVSPTQPRYKSFNDQAIRGGAATQQQLLNEKTLHASCSGSSLSLFAHPIRSCCRTVRRSIRVRMAQRKIGW